MLLQTIHIVQIQGQPLLLWAQIHLSLTEQHCSGQSEAIQHCPVHAVSLWASCNHKLANSATQAESMASLLLPVLTECGCGRDPHWSSPWEGPTLKKLMENHLPWEGLHPMSRGRVGGVFPPRRKHWKRQHVINWSQPPVPVSLHCWWRRRQRIQERNSAWEERKDVGRSFKIWFYFSLSYSDLIDNKLY